MTVPIFSLQDVDPYNQGLMSNDPNTHKKAVKFYSNPHNIYEYNRSHAEARSRKIASTTSAIGGVISLIPHPATRIIGGLMQIPDIIYDTKDFVNDHSLKNGIHLGLDGFQFIPGLTKYMGDDVLSIPGIIDNGYTGVTGRDGLEDIQGVKKKVQSKKSTTKKK